LAGWEISLASLSRRGNAVSEVVFDNEGNILTNAKASDRRFYRGDEGLIALMKCSLQ
jgi:hypothetical protein